MKAETLKKAILQYAMEGKLVAQDQNDEPASELLKRIKAEKEQLINDGKIKKEKPLPPITEDEIPYELPQGWEWVRFHECIDVRDGTHDSPKYVNQGYPFVTSKNLNNGKLDFSNVQYISEEDYKKFSQRSYVENEDILFAMIGSIGNPVIVNKDREFSIKNVALFKKSKYINTKWVYYYLLHIQEILKSNASGAVQSFVSLSVLRNYLFALPPLEEQKRIVEKLEEILPLVEEYGKNEEKLSKLNETLPKKIRQSILQHAVQGKLVPQDPNDEPASELLKRIKAEKEQLIKEGKLKKEKPLPPITKEEIPYELPQSWEWVRLGEIGLSNIGLTYKPTDITLSNSGIPVLRSSNIQNNKIDLNDLVRVTTEIKNENLYVQSGDILICARNGSKQLVGKSAIIRDLSEPMTFGAFMAIFRSTINSWVKVYLDSPLFKKTLESVNTVTINQITQNNLKNAIIPLPPFEEQKRIVAKVDELMQLVDKLEM